MKSAGQDNEWITAWAAPEIVKGGGTITREADVFGFGMVVIEVGPHDLSHPVLEAEVRLTSECRVRHLREGVHSTNSQPRSLLQRSSMANDQIVRKRGKD